DILNAFGDTGSGEINFYANGSSANPLLVINFGSGYVDTFNFGADAIFIANNVTITGSQITGDLSDESFSFAFANPAHLEGSEDWNDGFTATAAFTSSAVPEPATIALLTLGALSLIKTKK
ncbi:MAG: PEP-CTERM sorting domain-containing protein, partial [Phycisphaerae bacterium]|nr:PEP-CTERM sorting domain-containing protein [Phycisphaerae bacterium]